MLKFIQNPNVRFTGAVVMFLLSLVGGLVFTVFVSQTLYEKVLMAISWAALVYTSIDIMATTDIRKKQK